jgi:hypothetical protein
MRKVCSALASVAGLAILASPAWAQAKRYPPTKSEDLTITRSAVRPGGSVVVGGEGAKPNATVVIALSRVSSSSLGAGARKVATSMCVGRRRS